MPKSVKTNQRIQKRRLNALKRLENQLKDIKKEKDHKRFEGKIRHLEFDISVLKERLRGYIVNEEAKMGDL